MGGGTGQTNFCTICPRRFWSIIHLIVTGFFSIFPHEMVCHGDELLWASGVECIILLEYNVQSRLNFPINIVMVMVIMVMSVFLPFTHKW